MRMHVKWLVKRTEEIFDLPEPIVEIGSFQVSGQENYADMRPFFKEKIYIGCDMRNGKGVDRIENVESLSFADNSIGSVLMLETLEHVKNPIKALKEIWRVIKDNGYILISSQMNFPIHDHPFDYWRFTPELFNAICEEFQQRVIISWGNPLLPHTVVALGYKSQEKGKFKDNTIRLIESLPKIYPDTLRKIIKLILAKKLRMHETYETQKDINKISYDIYSKRDKLLSGSIY